MQHHLVSLNPTTQQSYPIPPTINDRANIDAFLARFPERRVVVVQGLGFVGAVMSIVCANADGAEYAVIGVDLPTPESYWKICEINLGHFPIKASDPNVELYFQQARKQGNFYATADSYAYSRADVIIVDVNLDVDKQNGENNELLGYSMNLEGFQKALKAIGDQCREDVLVVVETTVPPGTCRELVYPIISQGLENRGLSAEKLLVGHSYERVMPGPDYVNSIKNFYRVFAGIDEASAEATEAFLRTIISTKKYPLTRLGNTNASEMAKVLENAYRAMNIAFVVEWSRFAEEAGVNLWEVVDAIRKRPTHANLMFPNIGVGGYCLTKDALMASWARQHFFGAREPLVQSETGIAINDLMPFYSFEFMLRHLRAADLPVSDTGGKLSGMRFLMLGASYRSDVADTRYSPPEYLYRFLRREGAEVVVHDPYVRFWEELALPVEEDLDGLLPDGGDPKAAFDAVVISTAHGMYRDHAGLYRHIASKPLMFVFDLVGIIPDQTIHRTENRRIRVLGRGDI